jgi:putative ATPase
MLFEKVIGRNVLTRLSTDKSILRTLKDRLAPHATLALAQTIPSEGSRLSDFVLDERTKKRLREAEVDNLRGKRHRFVGLGAGRTGGGVP